MYGWERERCGEGRQIRARTCDGGVSRDGGMHETEWRLAGGADGSRVDALPSPSVLRREADDAWPARRVEGGGIRAMQSPKAAVPRPRSRERGKMRRQKGVRATAQRVVEPCRASPAFVPLGQMPVAPGSAVRAIVVVAVAAGCAFSQSRHQLSQACCKSRTAPHCTSACRHRYPALRHSVSRATPIWGSSVIRPIRMTARTRAGSRAKAIPVLGSTPAQRRGCSSYV
ncbi:hypothetical protein C8Q77DRAFT_382220 [Trametes polyzona]|nr:hypothetical protein C8Q77DRAFT_382220 [Trametes polyzona]